jgi:hypothetical protein
MFKSFATIAGAAIMLATIAIASAQAKQIVTDAPKIERVVAQKVAKAHTQAPYFWLVLGVGF